MSDEYKTRKTWCLDKVAKIREGVKELEHGCAKNERIAQNGCCFRFYTIIVGFFWHRIRTGFNRVRTECKYFIQLALTP